MPITITIDGSSHTGRYTVHCGCDDRWTGKGQALGSLEWNPALAIAEAVVHLSSDHAGQLLDLRFSERFGAWLIEYWQAQAYRFDRENQRRMRLHG